MAKAISSVDEYLKSLPADRRHAISIVRETMLANLPAGFEEGIQYGMIGYFVPHSLYPDGYHCNPKEPLPFAHIASQKNHMAVYLMCIYGDEKHSQWFQEAWAKTGKKLDMGKSCVRFKKLEDVALDVIGKAVKRVPLKKYVQHYETTFKKSSKPKTAKKKQATSKKLATKKTQAKKTPAKKAAKAATKKPKAVAKKSRSAETPKLATKKKSVASKKLPTSQPKATARKRKPGTK